MSKFEDYANKYKHVNFKREDGILQIAMHKNGGAASWGAEIGDLHDEMGDAFYQVGRDPENRVVILTGTGDEFLAKVDFDPTKPPDTAFFSRILKEGRDLLHNLLDIDTIVIGAVNGPAWVHAELATLSDIVIASERASFADKAHSPSGVVPGDGVHVWWEMLLGPNRSRHFC